MIKILTACGSGINSSQEIANTIQAELAIRGIEVITKAVILTEVDEELLAQFDLFCPITKPEVDFEITIPMVISGQIMYKVEALYKDVIDEIEVEISKLK